VETKTSNRNNHNLGGSVEGVIKIEGQGQLPQEFITIGHSFEEALGRCTIRDDAQKNAIIVYKAQLELFEMWDEIQDLTNWLNASSAVGGFNKSLAAMTHTMVYIPEGAGIKLDKDSKKALMEMQQMRASGKRNDNNNEQTA